MMSEAIRMTLKDYVLELGRYGITYTVNDGRICLHGGTDKTRVRCVRILEGDTELEAGLILHEVAHNPNLLDEITERACIRWAEVYSDSLYSAVLCNIQNLNETREYADVPDEKQVAYLLKMGFSEEAIKDRNKFPSLWVKWKERTDWDTELEKYR